MESENKTSNDEKGTNTRAKIPPPPLLSMERFSKECAPAFGFLLWINWRFRVDQTNQFMEDPVNVDLQFCTCLNESTYFVVFVFVCEKRRGRKEGKAKFCFVLFCFEIK